MSNGGRLIHFHLPDPYGRIAVLQRLDMRTGRARFDLHGTRATGTLVFIPHTDTEHPLPVDLYIQYGIGDRWSDLGRDSLPQFNGVGLDGGALLRPQHQKPGGLRYGLNLHRPDTTWYRHTRYPDKAGEHATAVIAALLAHWLSLPQRGGLIRAAALDDARERIARITRDTINPGWEQISTTSAVIDRAFTVVEQLRGLLGDDP